MARSLTCALMENKLNDSQPAKRVWPGKGSSKFIFEGKKTGKRISVKLIWKEDGFKKCEAYYTYF